MFLGLTQFVKSFSPGAQLQQVKSWKGVEGWVLLLDFFPSPRALYLHKEGLRQSEAKLNPGSLSSHPVQLYLRAHFQNQRVAMAEALAEGLRLSFDTGATLELLQVGAQLKVMAHVPGQKPFSRHVLLAKLPPEEGASPLAEKPSHASELSAAEKRQARLLAKIQADVQSGETQAMHLRPLAQLLKNDPQAWSKPRGWPEPLRAWVQAEQAERRLPPIGNAHLGAALDEIHSRLRRAERKIQGARQRLAQVQTQQLPLAPQGKAASKAATKSPPRRKGPGLWVEALPGLWARVGRSAEENHELYRQARDRDLWFHVRGLSGAHVWIGRGQASFTARAEPSEELILAGCQLALLNAAVGKKGGSATVDFTERRYLRARKGSVGQLEIQRSETRFVRPDAAFEARIFKTGRLE